MEKLYNDNMGKENNYFELRNEKTIIRIRQILDELPDFVKEFFVGIQLRTSVLTRLNYAYDLRIFFNYLAKIKYKNSINIDEIALVDIEKITGLDIELFLEYLSNYSFNGKKCSCGENAKERKLCTIRSFLKYFFKKDKISANVSEKVDLPKLHDKSIIRLDNDEVSKILNEAENGYNLSLNQQKYHNITKLRDVALLTLFLGTGIRISECVGINQDDINFKNNSFSVTRKGGNKSILYFSDEVCDALKDYIDWLEAQKNDKTEFGNKISQSNALFFSIQGNRMSVRAIEILVKKYSYTVTPLKKITPHKLRSTYGTALYRETQDIYVVADVLGHKDVNTTKKHYAAMSDVIRKKASSAVVLRDSHKNNINENDD